MNIISRIIKLEIVTEATRNIRERAWLKKRRTLHVKNKSLSLHQLVHKLYTLLKTQPLLEDTMYVLCMSKRKERQARESLIKNSQSCDVMA